MNSHTSNKRQSAATGKIPRLVCGDPLLEPYARQVARRVAQRQSMERKLTNTTVSLEDFAAGHEYFGLHFKNNEWVLREWAPNATSITLLGSFTDWQEKKSCQLQPLNANGVWELRLPASAISHGDLYRLRLRWHGGEGDRFPAWGRRVVQDNASNIFNAQVWKPPQPYNWAKPGFRRPPQPPLVYEAHVGMAQEAARVGTYREFTDNILPRIADAGYNTIQLMAIQEHPYYGSFGYHVSNFFAVSSRFGTPEEFKELVDVAHLMGLSVIIDLVHSHATRNEVEGLSRFDGTLYQYFHDGPRGVHTLWDSRCFDYGKVEVLHFLLSNCRFWLDEYHVDGFRFDGITSMLYAHHGLGRAFTCYDDYFNESVDEQALVYLGLANKLIHAIRPDAITIAEDVSGMPGLAAPLDDGGTGFDYRLAMGIPDFWIKLIKETPDEYWPVGRIWHELTNKRHDEKTVSYAESHDQALVGDQTLIFRLIERDMYDHMALNTRNLTVDRGLALHKMIRLVTLSTAGGAWLNFMGNEFGHPEWIDFPRAGNNWSYHYARRLWHLRDDPNLIYRFLAEFDQAMLSLAQASLLLAQPAPRLLWEHCTDHVLGFERADLIFLFNFHPSQSYPDYGLTAPAGTYQLVLNSDSTQFGGHARVADKQMYETCAAPAQPGQTQLKVYLPCRTALVLKKLTAHP